VLRLGRVAVGLALAVAALLAGTTATALAASASGTVVRVLDGAATSTGPRSR
jgi:hypothetical protein